MISSDAFEVDVCEECGLMGYMGWYVFISPSYNTRQRFYNLQTYKKMYMFILMILDCK